ncbi:unnamed protein product [Jaminaea pallidilutea]
MRRCVGRWVRVRVRVQVLVRRQLPTLTGSPAQVLERWTWTLVGVGRISARVLAIVRLHTFIRPLPTSTSFLIPHHNSNEWNDDSLLRSLTHSIVIRITVFTSLALVASLSSVRDIVHVQTSVIHSHLSIAR